MKQCKFELQGDRFVCPTCGANYPASITGFVESRCGLANTPPTKTTPKPNPKGPGDHLHTLIRRCTREDYRPGCGCKKMVAKMNALGPSWCREHIDEIIAKMLTEAQKRSKWKRLTSLPGTKLFIKRMILSAIRKAERENES